MRLPLAGPAARMNGVSLSRAKGMIDAVHCIPTTFGRAREAGATCHDKQQTAIARRGGCVCVAGS
jgi:hypothetical protein